ncbi:hypothetical protein [Mammaliicoccus lentus]|uniref:hypothetical protein n=1 Tax=Mammaliicoccus lentus TaxID=42858 RepID=UPI001BDB3E37|nr:hypothetical protein [Mammaliicoccus lentus]
MIVAYTAMIMLIIIAVTSIIKDITDNNENKKKNLLPSIAMLLGGIIMLVYSLVYLS